MKGEQTKALEEMVASLTEQKVQHSMDMDVIKTRLDVAEKESLGLKKTVENIETELEAKER